MLTQNERRRIFKEFVVFHENSVVMSDWDFEVCWQGTDLKEHPEFASVGLLAKVAQRRREILWDFTNFFEVEVFGE